MPSDLWSFTLDFYARPGIEQACLRLQASGANVCKVLCGVWLGVRGVSCNARRLREIGQLAEPWHDDVVRPLRELRSQWKNDAQHDAALAGLRERVKALELEAERHLLMRLQTLTEGWSAANAKDLPKWLAGLTEGEEQAGETSRDALDELRVAAELMANRA